MTNSNYRNADSNVEQNGNEQKKVRKQVKNKDSSFSKVRIDCDKMSVIKTLCDLIIIRIIEVENDYLLDDTLSKNMHLLQKKVQEFD